jgi:hypothetical protein
MATTTTTSQTYPAQEAGVAQPQTTTQPPGGPFIRYANEGNFPQYAQYGLSFGSVVQQPLVAVPGYLRRFRLRINATGGSGTATVAMAADAPYNVLQNVTLRDAFGTVLVNMDGYSLKLWAKYSGGNYLWQYSDPISLPSYSPPVTGADGSGDFGVTMSIPLEFAKGYGCISMANASLLPTLLFNLNGAGQVYTTAPTTLPTIELRNDVAMYWLPQQSVAPPGLGSTRQAVLQVANPTIGSNSNQLVTFPRLGGYIDTFIMVLRDSNNNRIDAWPQRFIFWVDGIPLINIDFGDLVDDMADQFQLNSSTPGAARETGVVVLTRKTSLGQTIFGLLDTLETTLSTNPGTLLAVEGSPWGTIANAPATLSVIAGQIIPSGQLLQGLPEI